MCVRIGMPMRRITKKIFVLMCCLIVTGFYCEFLIYYVVSVQCSWPDLSSSGTELRAFILADTHLLGPRKGHWLDKIRREWQMHRGFQAIMTIHKPEVVFVLGDLFDEGEWSNEQQLKKYAKRFYSIFRVDEQVHMYVVAGNHDTGFHNKCRGQGRLSNSSVTTTAFAIIDRANLTYFITRVKNYGKFGAGRLALQRFGELMNSKPVQLITLKGNHFVMINSMAMNGDGCSICREAVQMINKLSDNLKNDRSFNEMNSSRPILLQHFPLYRTSDEICTEPEAPPPNIIKKRFRNKIDTISKEATDLLVTKIQPRAVFGGHTHHGCQIEHSYPNLNLKFKEYSVPSFSHRNRPDPKYMLVTISPNGYSVSKCGLPKETTIAATTVGMTIMSFVIASRIRTLGPSARRIII